MRSPKDVLVVTTSSVDGIKVKKYLKPVSAHVVAGTNIFSDFFASFSDVFGGRSGTYQRQITSLYNEAVERVKSAAYEIGANCILGLKIDMDEISGKGKSMFMLTAVGTAVILDSSIAEKVNFQDLEGKLENVGIDKIIMLKNRKAIIESASSGNLALSDDVWDFITANQVGEVFPFLMEEFSGIIAHEKTNPDSYESFFKALLNYIDNLPEVIKCNLLYKGISEGNEQLSLRLSGIIKDLKLFDYSRTMELLRSKDFQTQKRAIRVATYDKAFYNLQDLKDLKTIRDFIRTTFTERGERIMKKQLLSSKEKEAFICECGKTNDLDAYCSGCGQDLYGFKQSEIKASSAGDYIDQKIQLIDELIKL
ncbi:MAG: YbjQ family protein [Saprospiraceae bacterium]